MVVTGFTDRLGVRDGSAVLTSKGVSVAEVLDRLEAKAAAAPVAAALGLEALDIVAALAACALGGEGDDGPPLVQTNPPRPGLAPVLAEHGLATLWPHAPRPVVLALAAGLLQVHDFWGASHEAAQVADDLGEPSVAAYWHGIAHRREPDPGNASYWFRRVGRHPLFVDLAAAAGPLIQSLDPALAATLLPRGTWDPFAFIDLCTRHAAGAIPHARKLQRLEMLLLLRASVPS